MGGRLVNGAQTDAAGTLSVVMRGEEMNVRVVKEGGGSKVQDLQRTAFMVTGKRSRCGNSRAPGATVLGRGSRTGTAAERGRLGCRS